MGNSEYSSVLSKYLPGLLTDVQGDGILLTVSYRTIHTQESEGDEPMPRQKEPERWITGKEAADILSKGRARPVSVDYVRLLGVKGHVAMRDRDRRTKEYLEADVRKYKVRENTEAGKGQRGRKQETKP